MLVQQLNQALTFTAIFTSAGQSASGRTVTVDVINPAGSKIVSAAATTEYASAGLYTYTLSSGSVTTAGMYIALFKTTDLTVDTMVEEDSAMVGAVWIQNIDSDLATMQTALATNATAIGNVPANVWAVATNTLTGAGSIGLALASYTAALATNLGTACTNVTTLATNYTAALATNLGTACTNVTTLATNYTAALATNLAITNTTIANGVTLAASAITAIWSALTATLGGYATTTIGYVLAQYTALRAGKLDYLTQSIPTPPTTGQIATAVWTDLLAGTDFSTSSSIGALIKADVNAPIGNIPTTAAPTVAQIATALLTDLLSSADFNTAGSLGALLKTLTVPPTTAQIATALLQDLTSSGDFGTTGSLGALIKANLDTNVGSRLATSGYTAPDNADISSIKLKTDNLPLSPSATSDVTGATGTITGAITSAVSTLESNIVPPTAILIREEMDANSTKLANLDAAVSSRMATFTYTPPNNAGVDTIVNALPASTATIAAQTDVTTVGTAVSGVQSTATAINGKLPSLAAAQSDVTGATSTITAAIPNAATIAAAVWGYTTRTLSTFGSLVADAAAAVWAAATRTITSGGITQGDVVTALGTYGAATSSDLSGLALQSDMLVTEAAAASLDGKITVGLPSINVLSPVALDGSTITLINGNSYSATGVSGIAVPITFTYPTGLPSNIESYPAFYFDFPGLPGIVATPTWDDAQNMVTFTFTLTVSQSLQLTRGANNYRLYGTFDSQHVTDLIHAGICVVK